MKKVLALLFLVGASQVGAISYDAKKPYTKNTQGLVSPGDIVAGAISFNGLHAVKKLVAKMPSACKAICNCPKCVMQLGRRSFFAYNFTVLWLFIKLHVAQANAGAADYK